MRVLDWKNLVNSCCSKAAIFEELYDGRIAASAWGSCASVSTFRSTIGRLLSLSARSSCSANGAGFWNANEGAYEIWRIECGMFDEIKEKVPTIKTKTGAEKME